MNRTLIVHTPYDKVADSNKDKTKRQRRFTLVGLISETTNTMDIGVSVKNPIDNFKRAKGAEDANNMAVTNPWITVELEDSKSIKEALEKLNQIHNHIQYHFKREGFILNNVSRVYNAALV